VTNRRHRVAHLAGRHGVERILLGLDRAARPRIGPAGVALRDEPLDADGPAGRQEVVGAVGPQPVGHREVAVEVAYVEACDRGQLVDDHVGLGLGDGVGDLLGIERVDDSRSGAEVR
jgi:hypothetical protein